MLFHAVINDAMAYEPPIFVNFNFLKNTILIVAVPLAIPKSAVFELPNLGHLLVAVVERIKSCLFEYFQVWLVAFVWSSFCFR